MCGERTGAVVLWQPSHNPSRCCTLVVVEERPPHVIVKHFGWTAIHNKALYKCLIHSFIHPFIHLFMYSDINSESQAIWSPMQKRSDPPLTVDSLILNPENIWQFHRKLCLKSAHNYCHLYPPWSEFSLDESLEAEGKCLYLNWAPGRPNVSESILPLTFKALMCLMKPQVWLVMNLSIEQTLVCKSVPVKGRVFSIIREKDRSFGNRDQ